MSSQSIDDRKISEATTAYNRRAKGYRVVTEFEVRKLLAEQRAMFCEYCHELLLAGNSSLRNNYQRHLDGNIRCLRIRANGNSPTIAIPTGAIQ